MFDIQDVCVADCLSLLYVDSRVSANNGFLLQWNMENSNDTDIDAIAAWGIHTGSANDIIGIVDDGNVMTPSNPHSEFSGRVIYGDATPVINLDGTGFSHAALVAGIAAS